MNTTLLIQAIVRQTTVLIASLATASGQRAQLATLANLVFADLVRELREQGVANKVIADMFGLALRTYHRKVAKLSASRSVSGHSLWEAVLTHIQQHGPVPRSAVLQRFAHDDEASVSAVLFDLIESGLIREDGEPAAPHLSASDAASGAADARGLDSGQLDSLVMVALHRAGPMRLEDLAGAVPANPSDLTAALDRLCEAGLATRCESARQTQYSCENLIIALGESAGWEAAVFDHYQALVTALVTKLRAGARKAELGDRVGGSTFTFDLWTDHPMQEEITGFLREMRRRGMQLRSQLEQHNTGHAQPAQARALRVTAYIGQVVTSEEEADA